MFPKPHHTDPLGCKLLSLRVPTPSLTRSATAPVTAIMPSLCATTTADCRRSARNNFPEAADGRAGWQGVRRGAHRQTEQVEALQQRIEVYRQQVEHFTGQVTRLTADYRALAATLRTRWN